MIQSRFPHMTTYKYLHWYLTTNRQKILSTQAANIHLISVSRPYSAMATVFFFFTNENTKVQNIWIFNGMKETVVSNCSLSECYSICKKSYDRSSWNIISIIYASGLKNCTVNIRQLHSVGLVPCGLCCPVFCLKN